LAVSIVLLGARVIGFSWLMATAARAALISILLFTSISPRSSESTGGWFLCSLPYLCARAGGTECRNGALFCCAVRSVRDWRGNVASAPSAFLGLVHFRGLLLGPVHLTFLLRLPISRFFRRSHPGRDDRRARSEHWLEKTAALLTVSGLLFRTASSSIY
jgi:hypothetical protein